MGIFTGTIEGTGLKFSAHNFLNLKTPLLAAQHYILIEPPPHIHAAKESYIILIDAAQHNIPINRFILKFKRRLYYV